MNVLPVAGAHHTNLDEHPREVSRDERALLPPERAPSCLGVEENDATGTAECLLLINIEG